MPSIGSEIKWVVRFSIIDTARLALGVFVVCRGKNSAALQQNYESQSMKCESQTTKFESQHRKREPRHPEFEFQ